MGRSKPTRPSSTAVATGAKSSDPATARVVTAVSDDVRDLQLNPALPRSGAEGDVFYRDASGRIVALPAGVAAQVLTMVGDLPAWSTASGGVPDGDKGDIIVTGGGTIWTLDPAALSGRVPTSRTISTTAPLAGGGDLSADRTLSVATFGAGASGVVPASGGGTTNFLRADGTWTAPGGGGGSASSTTVDVDFGATPDTTATATVAAAWVAVGTQIVLRPMGDTADHTAEDAAIEEVNAVAVNLVAGVGFDVIAHSPLGSTGQYRFAAVGV